MRPRHALMALLLALAGCGSSGSADPAGARIEALCADPDDLAIPLVLSEEPELFGALIDVCEARTVETMGY